MQCGVAASYAVWSVASSFAVFVLARLLGGLSKGNVSLAYSIMTDILDTSTRAVGMVGALQQAACHCPQDHDILDTSTRAVGMVGALQ